MYGQIIKFDPRLGVGVIAADDGRRFRFFRSEVMNASSSLVGHEVDFMPASHSATDIIIMSGSAWTVFGGSRLGRAIEGRP